MVNLGNMMKQAQQLQKKIAEAQDKLNDIEVEGTSGGGLVKVTSTAKGTFKRILIDESLFKNDDLQNPCNICSNNSRDKNSICVVEDVSDLWTFEKVGFYRGLYHVLGGSLSAIQGIGTDELRLNNLLKRIEENNIQEIILALSTTMEGQTTSFVLADKLEKFQKLNVTRLAQGIPMGGELHYLDENTLSTAFQSRKKFT